MSEDHECEISPVDVSGNEILEKIDEEGDVELQAGSKRFLVSSKLLSLASPAFKRMLFDTKCVESETTRSSNKPLEILMGDDDSEGLEILLNVLHFSRKKRYESLEPEQLLQVAKLADKYFCTSAISYQTQAWLAALKPQDLDTSNVWKLCAATYLTGYKEDFARYLSRLSIHANPDMLEGDLEVLALPNDMLTWIELIEETRYSIMQKFIKKLEKTMKDVDVDNRCFDIDYKICTGCYQHKPLPTKTCHYCNTETFWNVCCNPSLRLLHFLAELQRCGVWPLILQIDAIPFKFQQKLRFDRKNHKCDGHAACPLIEEFEKLESYFKREIAREDLVKLESLSGRF